MGPVPPYNRHMHCSIWSSPRSGPHQMSICPSQWTAGVLCSGLVLKVSPRGVIIPPWIATATSWMFPSPHPLSLHPTHALYHHQINLPKACKSLPCSRTFLDSPLPSGQDPHASVWFSRPTTVSASFFFPASSLPLF